ncbi:MAG: cation:proton antiporter [Parachlamydiaceae bacterium]
MIEQTASTYNVEIVMILAVGFVVASLFGYLSQLVKFSPIFGYLIAGYIIGPFSPGFVADANVAEQLAEIGVILMMFGVGLHLKWQELLKVKYVAIPGALIQTFFTTVAGAYFVHFLGWTIEAGIVVGLSIGVASTVVMIRVLSDHKSLDTPEGHIAVGWLIVEDILTVIALLFLPELALSLGGEDIAMGTLMGSIGIALFKCAALVLITVFIGFRAVAYIFDKVARTRSQELFTLTVLGLIFGIATGSAYLFGTSIALGAFIAGLIIGQTDVKHQASANALPLKDAFAVIFFLSVGMLFNPLALIAHFPLFIGILTIILFLKPLIAFITVRVLKYPFKTALIVAATLAQIGEFSFILSEEALKLKIIPEEGYDIIVGCALISIALNPLFFTLSKWVSKWYSQRKNGEINQHTEPPLGTVARAIIVGFGPIGQDAARILEELGMLSVIIDTNVDTVSKRKKKKREAVFGDASVEHILEAARAERADLLVITIPDVATTENVIRSIRHLNPGIRIVARTTYSQDKDRLNILGATVICDEEESRRAFALLLAQGRS